MSYYTAVKKTRLAIAPPATAKSYTVPSSVGGINSLNALDMMPPQDCIYTYNLMPVEYGLELRKGYREWANGCGTFDVRTILNYESNQRGIINDRLWAVTAEGIWNVSNFGETTPTQDAVFLDQTEPAGYGVKAEFTADSGEHYMFYADGVNGLWQYGDTSGLWTQPVGGLLPGEWSWDPPGGGADQPFPIDDIAFVMLHKLRIWVVLEDQDDGWYLPVGAIAGKLERFIFGSKMPRGGRLMGLWSWTIDGGDGVDDYLIAIGRAGDVIVYRGDDPSIGVTSTTGEAGQPWSQSGAWYIGDMTASRRPVVEYGSELLILSSFGITNLPTLLGGVAAASVPQSPSAKITRFLRRDVKEGITGHGWSLTLHPADGFLQVITPEPSNTPFVQYNQNMTTKAWGLWEGVPMLCGEEWNGEYFMGGKAGVVWIYDGSHDGALLDATLGEPIPFRTLTSFQTYGSAHGTFKRVGFIRTVGVTSGTVTFNVQAVYDYNINVITDSPTPLPAAGGSEWNSSVWNSALWAGGLSGESLPSGASGLGRAIAVGINGSADARITMVAWDITVTEGNVL